MWEPNDLERQRLAKIQRLREQGLDPYPPRAGRTHTTAGAIAAFEADEAIETRVIVCGRLRSMRVMGKAAFAHIEDGTGRVQLRLTRDNLGEETYEMFRRDLDLFDFVQAGGTMMRTKTGEATVLVDDLRVLAKAASPLPVKKTEKDPATGEETHYGGLEQPEDRYRERYADLATNEHVRDIFRIRARTISALRRFLDDEGFLEVETPILQPIYGGAAARPFVTHHNQLHQDLFLRVSFELYLKRLLVGMYDAVYEIGRDFRNEGVSRKHNPEFTQIEFYKAYIDYHGVMDLTERMVAFVAQHIHGTTKIPYQGHTIELAPPWRRVTLREAIKEHAGIDYAEHPDADSLRAAMESKGKTPNPNSSWGQLIDDLLGTDVEPNIIQPTFMLDYPRDISPFAKQVEGDPAHVERFEFFIAKLEMGNAFTELNDPLDQEERFLEMARLYSDDEDEAQPLDEDYLRAMRYGMPPSGGFGMGVDRLVMLMADQSNIREVLLYPHLREQKNN